MEYLWSARNNAFFPKPMIKDYESSGWNVDDAIIVDGDVYAEFSVNQKGKNRVVGCDGMPAWEDTSSAPDINWPQQPAE